MMNHQSPRGCHRGPLAFTLFISLAGCAGTTVSSLAPAVRAAGSLTSEAAAVGRDAHVKKVLYVSNLLNNVTVFPASIHAVNPAPLATITDGATRPEGLWVDGKATLYVVNGVGLQPVSVAEYKRGTTSPDLVIEDGLVAPTAVAVGSDGTVYVSDVQATKTGVVVVYGPGQSQPERTITLPDPAYALQAGSMAFDARGNLLVATLAPINNTVHVFSIAPGSSQPLDLGIQGAGGASIAIDGAGNLYTAGAPNDDMVAIYAPGATNPSRTYSLGTQMNFITVAANGTLYAGVLNQRTGVTGVAEIAAGASTITNLIDKGQSAYGVALGSR